VIEDLILGFVADGGWRHSVKWETKKLVSEKVYKNRIMAEDQMGRHAWVHVLGRQYMGLTPSMTQPKQIKWDIFRV
jgi:hypothetical protein